MAVIIPEEQSSKLVAFLKGGASLQTAAAASGISPETLDEWMTDLKFLDRISGAMREARLLAEIDLRRKAPGTWLNRNPAKQVQSSEQPKNENSVHRRRNKERPLTTRQAKFVKEYLKDSNGTRAAIRAGYSPKGAEVVAYRMLRIAKISGAIEKHRNRVFARMDIDEERILREVAVVAFNDPAKFFDADGNLLPITEMPEEARRALAGFEVEQLFEFIPGEGKTPKGTVTKIRIRDKMPALLALMKKLGILTERVDVNGNVNVTHASEERNYQLALLRSMTVDERRLFMEIIGKAQARMEAAKNGKAEQPAIETTVKQVDELHSPPNRP